MYGNNASSAGANSTANMQQYASPFFELGLLSVDFPSRQLSPGMGSTRLGFTPMATPGMLSTQQQVGMMFPAVTGQQSSGPPPMPEGFEQRNAKQAMAVTNRFANIERNSKTERSRSSSSVPNAASAPSSSSSSSSTSNNNNFDHQTTSIYARNALGIVNSLKTNPNIPRKGVPLPSSSSSSSTSSSAFAAASSSGKSNAYQQQQFEHQQRGGNRSTAAAAAAGPSSGRDGRMYTNNSNNNHANNYYSTAAGSISSTGIQMGDNNNQQQGNGTLSSSAYQPGSFFESPLMSNSSMMDMQNRLSPPTSTAFLNMPLPETPTNTNKMSLENVQGVSLDHKLKRSAAVVNKLMNAERQVQTQRERRSHEESPPSTIPGGSQSSQSNQQQQQQQQPPRLFAPLEPSQTGNQSGLMRSNSQQQQQQQQQGGGGMLQPGQQQSQPGSMTNLLRSTRLSSTIAPGEEGFFDMPFGGADFGYTFSPGEMVRSLNPAGIPESPLTQNLRMFPYTSGYNSLVGSTPSWPPMSSQFSHASLNPSLATPAFPTGSMGGELALPASHASMTGKGRSAKRRKDSDSDLDDADEGKPKKKKKPSKPVDPNEPKITSRHRGVCWYKRTKKWVVQTKVNGKRVHVGYFDDEEKAAEAYKNAVQGIQIKKALEAKKSMEEAAASGTAAASADSASAGGESAFD